MLIKQENDLLTLVEGPASSRRACDTMPPSDIDDWANAEPAKAAIAPTV